MEPLLIYTDSSFEDAGAVQSFSLDMAFGSDEQDFEATFTEPKLSGGELLYIDGTEYGGIIDSIRQDTDNQATTYCGRTWHGMLAAKVVKPPANSNYYTASGDANACLTALISYVGLSGVLTARSSSSGITIANYQFPRFCNAYAGALGMLGSANAKLVIQRHDGITEVWAEPVSTIEDRADSDLMQFEVTENHRVPNHLVAAGQGELQDRVVVDLYADANGNVSTSQTFTGVDEIAVYYDYTGADAAELTKEGTEELKGYQSKGGADIKALAVGDWYVGDRLQVRDNRTGTEVTSTIAKKIVRVGMGVLSVDYEVGEDVSTKAASYAAPVGGHVEGGGAFLPLSGGNLTGNLGVKNTITLGTHTTAEENGIRLKGGGTRNAWVLRTISAANGDGDAVLLGDGGLTIIGAGEAAPNLWTALGVVAGSENLHLASDSNVYVHSNCQTVADRYSWEFNTAGNLSGPDGGSYVANNGQFYADSDGLTSGTHPSSETAGRGVIFRDSANAIIGVIQPRFGTSAQGWQALRFYAQRSISGAAKYNILDLRVDDSGDQVVYTNNAGAWRTALGLGTAATHADTDYADASHSHSEYFSDQVNRTANTVLAAPNGSAGHASFRRLAMADLVSSFHHNTSHVNIPVVTTAPTAVNTQNWNYEVYSDGEVHAWGTFMRTVALTTKLGDGFYWNNQLLYLALPVKAKFIQSVNYSMSLGGSGVVGAYCMPGGTSHTVWSGATFYLPFYIARPVSTASQSYWFSVDVWYMKA